VLTFISLSSGVSQVFPDDDDSLKQSAGSPAFLAPELCSAGAVARGVHTSCPNNLVPPLALLISVIPGRQVDVWALGITLYCMVFGTVPFIAENVLDIYEKIRLQP
jgi:serine/threonine protein kinase